jgi:mannose-6-phosphate isomerase-like protein (cupin superfamily)
MAPTSSTVAALETDRRQSHDPRIAAFARDGFLGPLPIFSPTECRRIAAYLHHDEHPAPADWDKGRAVHERFLYELATHPAVLSPLGALLGEDVVLWGVCAVLRAPGATHPWHSDIESSSPAGRFVTVWIGLEHTSRESALQVISRSHRLGKTVQQTQQERGLRRDQATPELMLAAAREREPEASLLQPDMRNGDALLFDGRLWHGSDNTRRRGRRLALLLQYAAADTPVRIPDFSQLAWPFRLRPSPRPPVILVSGTDRCGINRLVPAPPPNSKGVPMVATAIHQFSLPLESPGRPWQRFIAFRGPTRTLADMSCHASVLGEGHSPHPPHAHREEELLIPLHGEAELRIADGPSDTAPRIERLHPGSFVYYPAWQHHTIRNPGTSPVAT